MPPSIETGNIENERIPRSISPADSEYGSMLQSVSLPDIIFTSSHLKYLNQRLSTLEPEDILRWCLISLPGLFQTTALGLTGLVTIDMLSRISPERHPVPLVFVDTLHHFPETLSLLSKVKSRYPTAEFNIFTPEGTPTASSFTAAHGSELWSKDGTLYDYLVKVEPARRAYSQLNVKAVLTGRRKSQGGARGSLDIIEIDETGLVKINPLANWSFKQVEQYIRQHNVPYNELLDRGYRSVGDWHSTVPVKEGEDERAGRWKGQAKTECGLHENYLAMRIKAKLEVAQRASAEGGLAR